jgi:hypothetical protein
MEAGIDGRMRTLEETLGVGWRKRAEEARESIPSTNWKPAIFEAKPLAVFIG